MVVLLIFPLCLSVRSIPKHYYSYRLLFIWLLFMEMDIIVFYINKYHDYVLIYKKKKRADTGLYSYYEIITFKTFLSRLNINFS